MNYYLTSESVTEGHPDKVCDKIADKILDYYLTRDSKSHVAVEVSVTEQFCLVFGEASSSVDISLEEINNLVRKTIIEIGYDNDELGFNGSTLQILNLIKRQSQEISDAVVNREDQGAGDQGIMFGFASKETSNYMPLPIQIAHELAHRLTYVRKQGITKLFRPDGKTQVTVEYSPLHVPLRIDSIVVSVQHDSSLKLDEIVKLVKEHVIKPVVDSALLDENTKYHINPSGSFVVGGPKGDSGLTGRKIISDTYGGAARHGGGSFSGKDPSKVDRSSCYYLRYIAKNLVAANLASKLEIQVSYAIGEAKPLSILVETFNTNKVEVSVIHDIINNFFSLRPGSIINSLDLLKPIYSRTSVYGHFGKDEFNWEKLDKVSQINQYLISKGIKRV
jgi:S-adenosylmethionine synthetase